MNEIKTQIALELRSLYGINKYKHTKDKKSKNRYTLLMCVWIFLAVMITGYVSGLVYGLSVLELSSIVPAYLVFIASMLVFVFGVFKSGSTIFSKNRYDIISSMPIRTRAIVIGRLFSMYVEDLALTLLIMLPGVITLGIIENLGIGFYVLAVAGSLFIPFVPLCLSIILGTPVFAVSSRSKHKSLTQTFFAIAFMLAVFVLSFSMEKLGSGFTPEMLKELADTVSKIINSIYPPAIWLGSAMLNFDIPAFTIYPIVSLAISAITVVIVSLTFHSIIRGLFSFSSKHDYKLGKLQSRTHLKTLYMREAKRYFSSSIYVTNTIIGPVMAMVASIALSIIGIETISSTVPLPNIEKNIPFAISAICCMMTTTSVSISMEGKQFTLIKSLPIDAKTLFDSKILLNLSLILPFYVISEIFMIIALKPSLIELIWIILIPILIILFSTVFGITVNLKLHSFDWENEVTVVKQSAPAALGGFAGPLLSLVFIGIMIVIPITFFDIVCLLLSLALLVLTALLYNDNSKITLENL